MLKKIVKYGNSSAILLDKAILELLNIQEGSVLKIKTDGESLILTPIREPQKSPVSGKDFLIATVQEDLLKQTQDPNFLKEYDLNAKKIAQVQPDFDAINKKYASAQEAFFIQSIDPESSFFHELEALKEAYQYNDDKEGYAQAAVATRNKYFPELAQRDIEFMAVAQKLLKNK